MTEEIIIDKENFWDMFEQHPVKAVDGLFSKIETIVNLLKRLEQENEKLSFQLKLAQADYEASEQENKELKELKCKFKEYCTCDTERYRSALEEIREKIKSLNKDICNNCGWYNTDNCQPNGYVCHDLIEIKNKINEVLK